MRTRMDRENRAKQFMPFAALKGYPDALRSVEQVWEPQTELSEESEEELNKKLCQIQKGDVIRVKYYCNGTYRWLGGPVDRLDKTDKYLSIGETKIYFSRLYRVEIDIAEYRK